MTICTYCDQDTTTAGGCGCPFGEPRAGAGTAPPPVVGLGPPPERPPLVPFGAAVAPLRARHRELLAELASWSLAAGRPVSLDVAALALDVLARHRVEGGELHRMQRPDVARALQYDVRNRASMLTTLLPEGVPGAVWSVVTFLHDTGRLCPDSDPVDALREPLRCYGGLGPDGNRRPEGEDIDFPCQCYVPHDPTLPPGMAQLALERGQVVRAWAPGRGDDLPQSCFRPLARFARRVRRTATPCPVFVDEFLYRGRTDAAGATPALWIYALEDWHHLYADLVVDEHGDAYAPKEDGRRKAGFRWVRISDRDALHRCGAWRAEQERRDRHRPPDEPPDDEWDEWNEWDVWEEAGD